MLSANSTVEEVASSGPSQVDIRDPVHLDGPIWANVFSDKSSSKLYLSH
jgi:hypothetical protein